MDLLEFLHDETTIESSDIKFVLLTSVMFYMYRKFIETCFLKPLSVFVAEKQRNKFIYRGFDAIHYITSTIIGLFAFSQRPYAHCPFYILDCVQYIGCNGETVVCSMFEKVYYYYFTAYYLSDIVYINTNKEKGILVFHHSVTLTLMYLSVIATRHVFMFCTMVLHDLVDVFLYIGKVASYLEIKKLSDIFLCIFAVSFFYLRIFVLGSFIYIYFTEPITQTHHHLVYTIGKILFCGLYCCHIIWGSIIIKAIIKLTKGGTICDTRSEGEIAKKNHCE